MEAVLRAFPREGIHTEAHHQNQKCFNTQIPRPQAPCPTRAPRRGLGAASQRCSADGAQPRLAGRLEGELDRQEGAQTPNLAWDSPRKLVAWLSQMEGREVCPPEDLRVSIVAPPDNG